MHKIARCLFVLFLLIAPQLFAGTVYYVATTGNDSYNGLYPSYQGGSDGPFRTLSKAANRVRPGDTVRIRGGKYQEVSYWSTDGTQANPITITNYNGEKVVIDGNRNTIPADEYGVLLEIKGDWYTVSNLEISYSGYYGLMSKGEHCTIDHIDCHHSWAAGITAGGSYALVQNCRAWYNSSRYEFAAGPKWSTGISIMGPDPYYSVIRNCVAWDNWGQGIKAALCHYATIEDCISYNNYYNYYVRECKHCLFQRNLSYCTPGNLISQYVQEVPLLIGDEGPTLPSSDNTFINNLIMGGRRYNASIGSGTFENGLFAYNTLVNAVGGLSMRIGKGTYSNARFMNNIILQEDSVAIGENEATGVTLGHNNWSKLPHHSIQGTGDIIAHPLLAKTGPTGAGQLTPGWFKILEGSPARDRAKVLSEVTRDFFKTLRGGAPDMGAHEFTGGTSPLTASASGSPTSGQAPLTVNFTGGAGGGVSPYSYRWTFGDGGSSTSQNPSHTYVSAGSYTATLTVTDNASATASKSLTITATTLPTQLTAIASADPAGGPPPLMVSFTGSASGGTPPYSYSWDFGDGASSLYQNPGHVYSNIGNYIATLTVTDYFSSSATTMVNISVSTATTAVLALSAVTGAPAPGEGGTTSPAPGNHSYSIGSVVEVGTIPRTDYRFSRWDGDIAQADMFNPAASITMSTNKSLLATFCTKCADVNGDLKITPADAQITFDIFLAKIAEPTWCELENADVNCNGTKLGPRVTPADAQIIFRKYLRKGGYDSDCSGNSRAAVSSQKSMAFSASSFTIDASFLTSEGDLLVPIIIETPSAVGAFGFDLEFPSDKWTFVGLEGSDLTANFEQLSGNVVPYRASGNGQQAADIAEGRFLRVGGYKTSDAANASVGVLVTLVFRAKGGFAAPGDISIIASYDDIQNATISVGNSQRKRCDDRRFEKKRPVDRGRGKELGRTSDD
jgi:PKD repeat protein